MFNLPITKIDFKKVVEFCNEGHEEGLDLDYKGDWETDLDHLLCAMANTQGGMVLVGVREDKITRKPVGPPVGVPGTKDELNQKVIQIAFDAIYPPVIPEVAVCPLDNDPSRSVVVIRVPASRLLHATDGRTKIYIKVADHKRRYDLANVSQLEWLFQQREKSASLRDQILNRAQERADQSTGEASPTIWIYAVPYYAGQVSKTDPPELLKMVQLMLPKETTWPVKTEKIPLTPSWRPTFGGAYAFSRFKTEDGFFTEPGQYAEVGSHGLVYFQRVLSPSPIKLRDGSAYLRLEASHLLCTCDTALLFIEDVLSKMGLKGPVFIRAGVKSVKNILLVPGLVL